MVKFEKMINTEKEICRRIASLLSQSGVKDVVVSPGTRNAPMLTAMASNTRLRLLPVVDERSAAFIALGAAMRSSRPVALCCTSGTAVLDYAPAIAEAYYRHVPLIVITADRPADMIDQLRGQTLHQPDIYEKYIRHTLDIADTDPIEDSIAKVKDAIIIAQHESSGPVHINLRLTEPLGNVVELPDEPTICNESEELNQPAAKDYALLREALQCRRTWILCGPAFYSTSRPSAEHVADVGSAGNIVIMAESTSNLPSSDNDAIADITSTLVKAGRSVPEDLLPEVIITTGAALVSQSAVCYIKNIKGVRHICVSTEPYEIDTFGVLAETAELDCPRFFELASSIVNDVIDTPDARFKDFWFSLWHQAAATLHQYLSKAPWSQFTAMNRILTNLPLANLYLSNGMTIRYAQAFNTRRFPWVDCNRGVSGIDGSLSTAIGGASVADRPTTFITGDMSFQYDMSALATTFIPDSFRVIVMNNGGGGIFRYITNTRSLPIAKTLLHDIANVNIEKIAGAFGFEYFRVDSNDTFDVAFLQFCRSERAILEVVTDIDTDTETFHKYYKTLKEQ